MAFADGFRGKCLDDLGVLSVARTLGVNLEREAFWRRFEVHATQREAVGRLPFGAVPACIPQINIGCRRRWGSIEAR